MNKHFNKFMIAGFSLMAFACDKDDLTGDSMLTPTNPTVSVEIEDADVSFSERDSTFTYTITLSEPQITDVAVTVKQVGGDATLGEDFTLGSSVVIIPANATTAVASVSVLGDDIPEGTETFTIQIGDEATGNASITPQTIEFTISNSSESDLALHMSWDSEYYDASGTEVAPTDVADMILYITDADGNVLPDGPDEGTAPDGIVDGAGFEDFVLDESFPDGEYLVKAGIFSRIDAGELGEPPLLDILLEFTQPGVIEPTTIRFVEAFDTELVCSGNRFTIASITKMGTTYTVEEIGAAALPAVVPFVGTHSGVDGNIDGLNYPAPGHAEVALTGGVYTIEGLNESFMVNVWGETIENRVPVELTIDAEGNITIEEQYIFTTLYDGDLYDYTIYGTGKLLDACGTMELNYEMSQDGFLVGEWLHANGYMSDELFKATLSLD
ncbi:MAG TPA: Calx-beta domain-containing protein [Chryseosolibacter sp.]|nr:Calx-beta domain-containing protein [Chryseosolibacter sp.]